LLGRIYERHDHTHRAGVEHLVDLRQVIARHPHQRRRLGGRDRRQHAQEVVVVDQAVLQVDHHPVEPRIGDQLGRMHVAER
jgi:hypothetical protein